MSSEPDDATKLEIAHILFTDMVSFTKLPMEEQKKAIDYLGKLVRETEAFRQADADNLIRLTTGDGFALVFFNDPEAPIKCARELGRQLRAEPRVKLRMGLHSGPVFRISNINERIDVTGSGINMAQRVMDCGDAGHILASGAVANNLGGLNAWSGDLHDLGRTEIQGGDHIRIFNVYGKDYGNPEIPAKLRPALQPPVSPQPGPFTGRLALSFPVGRRTIFAGMGAIALLILGILAVVLFSGAQYKSLAIVPFDFESDQAAAVLADDLPERLSSSLSDLPNKLSVKRSNQRIYKWQPLSNVQELGRSLGAQALLRGSLTKAGDSIEVDVHLIDVRNGKELWTKQYSKQLDEVGAIEQDILQMVTESLSIRLTDEEKESLASGPSKDSEANRLYEDGLTLWAVREKTSLQEAKGKFQSAVQKDPNFARAFAKLADTLVLQNIYVTPSSERMREAEIAANRALNLKPRLADAHISLAYINFRYKWDWAKAENEFKRAIELDDLDAQAHDWYADFLEAMNRSSEAVKQMEKAAELDRKAVWINADLGLSYCYADRFEDAVNQLTKTLSLAGKGDDFAQTHNYLGLTYEQKGMLDQAIAEYEKALEPSKKLGKPDPRLQAIVAHGYAISGHPDKAHQFLDELAKSNEVPLYYLALAYAALPMPDDKDRAFKLLNAALEKKEPGIVFLRIDPRLSKAFRQDPQFDTLLARLNLRR